MNSILVSIVYNMVHITNIHLSRTGRSVQTKNVSIFTPEELYKVAHGNPQMSARGKMDVIHVTSNIKLHINTIVT